MTLAMTPDHADMATAGLGLAMLYAAVFLGVFREPAKQLSRVRVKCPAQVRPPPHGRGQI